MLPLKKVYAIDQMMGTSRMSEYRARAGPTNTRIARRSLSPFSTTLPSAGRDAGHVVRGREGLLPGPEPGRRQPFWAACTADMNACADWLPFTSEAAFFVETLPALA